MYFFLSLKTNYDFTYRNHHIYLLITHISISNKITSSLEKEPLSYWPISHQYYTPALLLTLNIQHHSYTKKAHL